MKNTEKHGEGSVLLKSGRQAGVCMHISCLPGLHGIGDIADSSLVFLEDLARMDMGVWQFLPTGPTAYGNSPYQPLSAFAGSEMLLGLGPLVELGLLGSADVEPLLALPRGFVDFGSLIPVKTRLLEQAAGRFHQRPAREFQVDYEDFLDQHGCRWLDDYALFRVLKTLHGERPWPEWDKCFVHREPGALQKIVNEHRAAIERVRVIQFLFLRQWQALKHAANQKGIQLFGDMPIYIALDSSDAWSHPELLLIDKDGLPSQVAGVPPDYFSEDGQLWGNPIYDWACHEQTGYRWWVERMEHAASLSDLVRIDHFRGFESFWSVPFGSETARTGEWVPGPGDGLFEALRRALGDLPIVAEDLGVITPEVEALRRNQGMPGMAVLQFLADSPDFEIESIETNSVCYTGTHDNDTTLGWFRGTGEDSRTAEEISEMQECVLKHTGGTGATIALDMIRLAFSSQAALAVAPMQDYLGLGSEARLNIPGTTRDNWRWRLLESQFSDAFFDTVRSLVRQSSRIRPTR